MHDIIRFSGPLDAKAPGGANVEYDPEFLALERLAAPQEERGVGDAVKQAQEPDWKQVARCAESLATRTRDLRVVLHLTQAWLTIDGVPAFVDGLDLLRGLLENQWDDVHPLVEDDDPTERINSLAMLCADPGMLGSLRRVLVIGLERVGTVTLRDLRTLADTSPADDDESMGALSNHVAAIFGQAGESRLREIDTAATQGMAHLEAIGRVFAQRTPGQGPDIDSLVRELGVLRRGLRSHLSGPEEEQAETSDEAGVTETRLSVASQTSMPGTLNPDEIRRRLDEICSWYATNEPASPVPVVLRRARALIGMDFAALLQAVAPGGLGEFRSLAGED